MLKVVCKEYEQLQALGLLIGNDNFVEKKNNKKNIFKRLKEKLVNKNQ